MHGWKPRYNIAPSQLAPIVTKEGVDEARFGLVPVWEKEFNTKLSTINARAETVQTSKLYARLLKNNRCLIPATSFFEWATTDHGKQPMLIKLKARPLFYFAGLYDTWHKGDKDERKSFTILTTRPNSFMSKIHDRQPRILEEDQEKPWLNEDIVNYKVFFGDIFPSPQMEAYPVSSLVNRPANDFAEVIKSIV